MTRRFFSMTALAVVLFSIAGTSAQAAFNYRSVFVGATINSGTAVLNGGPTINGAAVTPPTSIIYGNPTITSTSATLETVDITAQYRVFFADPGQSLTTISRLVTVRITGPASATQSNLIVGPATFAPDNTPTTQPSMTQLTLSDFPSGAPQTTSPAAGSLQILVAAVPEPTSIALLGLGGLGALGLFRRRKAQA